MDNDIEEVWIEIQKLAGEYGQCEVSEYLTKDHAKEIVRYGGGELHTISALIGGVSAQEAVKIITHQYIPLNNTFIYNGIVGCADTYEL
jgi:amyloid beta precursor protein binding protein 1